MDGIVFKVRDNGKIINKTVYLCVGLKQNGLKEVLGMWVGKSESSSFWMGVLTDLKARGVQDILITSTDNLNGFTNTIRTVFPQSSTHICVVHQIRNSCKYVVYKDKKEFTTDMKNIYNAPNMPLRNLIIWRRNGVESILMPYFHGETTGMTWLFSSNSRWKSEK